jgi:hypothetical protein
MQDDEFFTKIRDLICTKDENGDESGIKKDFANSSDISGGITSLKLNDSAIEAVNDFYTALVDTTHSDINATTCKELLADDYVDKFYAMVTGDNDATIANRAKSCELIRLLETDLIVAWQTTSGEWLDSSGKKYVEYIDRWVTSDGESVSVDVMRTYTGVWQYANKNDITIKTVNSDSNTVSWVCADGALDIASDHSIHTFLDSLLAEVSFLGEAVIPNNIKDTYVTLLTEEQLLEDIRAIDKNRLFYYNVPIEANVAIDFNEGDAKLNTLMNPAINYDINNVNNNFVISKLDINYLDSGIQIARSSRI